MHLFKNQVLSWLQKLREADLTPLAVTHQELSPDDVSTRRTVEAVCDLPFVARGDSIDIISSFDQEEEGVDVGEEVVIEEEQKEQGEEEGEEEGEQDQQQEEEPPTLPALIVNSQRSGAQVYAKDRSLVVMGSVNDSAEVFLFLLRCFISFCTGIV